LYLVPTPIGNLDDITLRAIKVLKMVDLILAEDTRTTGVLLKHLEIKSQMQSYHTFNEHKTVLQLVERLKGGQKIALVSDAGTPGISDPGFLIVRECLRNDIKVECLPVKKGRQTKLKQLAEEERTMVFYESPHRLLKTLEHFAEYLGAERQASVSRELTKLFEETVNGTLQELITFYNAKAVKGELVIVVDGKK